MNYVRLDKENSHAFSKNYSAFFRDKTRFEIINFKGIESLPQILVF